MTSLHMADDTKKTNPMDSSQPDASETPGSITECPVCHMDLPTYQPSPGLTIECATCYADLEVSEDLARLVLRKFGGKAFGQL